MRIRVVVALLCAVLVNCVMGAVLAGVLGVPAWMGAVALNVSGLAWGLLPKTTGVLCAGVHVEVWTGQVVEHLTHANEGTFLDGVPDFSRYAENDTIHLVDIGADPSVLIDNTTYPLTIETLDDNDVAIKLSKFETLPTAIGIDDLYALSYDKMSVVKTLHGNKLAEGMLDKALHAFAPVENAAETPVVECTGSADETGRKRLQRIDILSLKNGLDKLRCPKKGRRLVLCNDHVNDLLGEDQKFHSQYYNYESGMIGKLYGFEVYEATNCPLFASGTKKKKSFGAVAADGDFEASVFFYVPRMLKCQGSMTMHYSEAVKDPVNKRNLIDFTARFVAMPQKRECATGAIVSVKSV